MSVNALKELKIRKKELENELKKVNNAINSLDPLFSQSMEWKKRSYACISNMKHYCTTVDILECLIGKQEMNNLSQEQYKKYITSLSVALNEIRNDGMILKFILKGFKGYYYGLPEWFDGAKPIQEYLPNDLKTLDIPFLLATGILK